MRRRRGKDISVRRNRPYRVLGAESASLFSVMVLTSWNQVIALRLRVSAPVLHMAFIMPAVSLQGCVLHSQHLLGGSTGYTCFTQNEGQTDHKPSCSTRGVLEHKPEGAGPVFSLWVCGCVYGGVENVERIRYLAVEQRWREARGARWP